MKSKNKKFNKCHFDECDRPGKEAVRKYCESFGYFVAHNPNKYAGDLILMERLDDGFFNPVAIVEVGIRLSWNSDEWPQSWSHLRIEARKAKYLNQELPVVFCILNKSMTAVVVMDGVLTDFPIEQVNNRFCHNEENYIIPIEDCFLDSL